MIQHRETHDQARHYRMSPGVRQIPLLPFIVHCAAVSKGGTDWESFKGRGETLNGRKTKGRGITARKIEDVQDGSKIYRTKSVSLSLIPRFFLLIFDFHSKAR